VGKSDTSERKWVPFDLLNLNIIFTFQLFYQIYVNKGLRSLIDEVDGD